MKIILSLAGAALLAGCQAVPMAPQPPTTYAPPRAEAPRTAPPVARPPSSGAVRPPQSTPPSTLPPSSTGANPPASADTACRASSLQHLVGRPLPQPFPAAGPVRIFTTGQPVTMDHNPQRLNVEVNPDGSRRIIAITCG